MNAFFNRDHVVEQDLNNEAFFRFAWKAEVCRHLMVVKISSIEANVIKKTLP